MEYLRGWLEGVELLLNYLLVDLSLCEQKGFLKILLRPCIVNAAVDLQSVVFQFVSVQIRVP